MILTNKFRAEYNYENIERDFDIYFVKGTTGLYNTNILDIPTAEYKALAVQHSFGKEALVLFQKGKEYNLNFSRKIKEQYPNVAVEKINVLDKAERNRVFYYNDRLLAQLLINSMKTPKGELFSYNNLTGKLYYGDSTSPIRDKSTKEIYMFRFLQISLKPGMYLTLDVKTFRKNSYSKQGSFYIIDAETGAFRKKLKSDKVDLKDTFAPGSYKNSHNTVEFLCYENPEKFSRSKLGIMNKFLEDVKLKLSDYLTLEYDSYDAADKTEIKKSKKTEISVKEFGKMLSEKYVTISDYCKDKQSESMLDSIVRILESDYNIHPLIDTTSESGYNIRIIYGEEYYENNKLPDPHKDDNNGLIVQHIIVENHSEEKLKNMVQKVVQELIIKGDIYSRKLSIYDWTQLKTDKTWSFVTREKIEGYTYPDSHFEYNMMTVTPTGDLNFETFNDIEPTESTDKGRIMLMYSEYNKENSRVCNSVEGLVFSDINNIHAIVRTCEFTIPDIYKLNMALKETNPNTAVRKENLINMINAFSSEYPQYADETNNLIAIIREQQPVLTKYEIRRFMNMQKKYAIDLNQYMRDKYGVWMHPRIQSLKNDEYLMSNIVNICCFKKDFVLEEGEEVYYYAGEKSLRRSGVSRACIIRKIISEKKMEFKDLLPLLSVEFVRNGQYTVVPFPFKYLREYIKISKNI